MSNRQKNNKKNQIELGISELKIQALILYLESKGTSLTDEINNFVVELYKKVPKSTREFISSVQGETESGTVTK